MPYTKKDLRQHPGLNPRYFSGVAHRLSIQRHNRNVATLLPLKVPKLVSRWIPHQGEKELAKGARRAEMGVTSLGALPGRTMGV